MVLENEAATGFAERFFRYFQHEVTALQEQMDSLANTSLVGGERDDAVDHCLAGIARLSQEVKDASRHLPAYDQRTYAQAVKALSEKLTNVRNAFAPRPKFTFKSALKTRSRPNSSSGPPASTQNGSKSNTEDTTSHDEPMDAAAQEANKRIRESSKPSLIHRPTFESSSTLTLSNHSNVYIAVAPPERGRAGRAAKVSDVTRSVIALDAASAAQPFAGVTLRNVSQSVIVCGNVVGPLHLTGIRDSVLVVACRQFRMHEATGVRVYLHCASRPIVEDCKGVGFAPLPERYMDASLSGVENHWNEVDDFKWLKSEASPNWAVIDETNRVGSKIWQNLATPQEGKENIVESTLSMFGVSR